MDAVYVTRPPMAHALETPEAAVLGAVQLALGNTGARAPSQAGDGDVDGDGGGGEADGGDGGDGGEERAAGPATAWRVPRVANDGGGVAGHHAGTVTDGAARPASAADTGAARIDAGAAAAGAAGTAALPVRVERGAVPINEFVNNGDGVMKAFAVLFVTGHGIRARGTLPRAVLRHLMLFHDGRFARSSQLVFHLFSQTRRHIVSRAVAARVRSRPDAMRAVTEVVTAPDFEARLERAVGAPGGEEASELLRQLLPHINVASAKLPYSNSRRRATMSKLTAYVDHYGLPSVFLTVSHDDAHDGLAIRLAIPSPGNTSFPAVAGDYLDALRRGDPTIGDVVVHEIALQTRIAENAVAAVYAFKTMVEHVYSDIIGLPLESCSQRTVPIASRSRGVFSDPQGGIWCH